MFTLTLLPYKPPAPVVTDQTPNVHCEKHLRNILDKLDKLIVGMKFEKMSLEVFLFKSFGVVFSIAEQILDHDQCCTQFMSCHSDRNEGPPLFAQVLKQWRSVDAFKSEYESQGVFLVGSGLVWLATNSDCSLVILPPGDNAPVPQSPKSLFTFDDWEHSYYMDHQNRCTVHLQTLWQIIKWEEIYRRFSANTL